MKDRGGKKGEPLRGGDEDKQRIGEWRRRLEEKVEAEYQRIQERSAEKREEEKKPKQTFCVTEVLAKPESKCPCFVILNVGSSSISFHNLILKPFLKVSLKVCQITFSTLSQVTNFS